MATSISMPRAVRLGAPRTAHNVANRLWSWVDKKHGTIGTERFAHGIFDAFCRGGRVDGTLREERRHGRVKRKIRGRIHHPGLLPSPSVGRDDFSEHQAMGCVFTKRVPDTRS